MNDNIGVEIVPGHKLAEMSLAKQAMSMLTKAYPGYMWRVGINDEESGGVLYIMNITINQAIFSNSPYGYTLKLSTVYADPDLKCILRAGGEILERAGMRRGWATGEGPKRIDGVAEHHQPLAGRYI